MFLELLSTASEKITVEYIFEINGPTGFSSPFGESYVSTDFTTDTNTRGYRKFIEIGSLQSQYLWNDCLTIFCAVEVHKESKTTCSLITVPPSGICQDLAQLLESKQGADVTFQVGGNDYDAHKAVVAMRSPVFRAQFFGPLADKPGSYVRIHDMTPAAFEAVIHFIYTDTLPPVKDDGDSTDHQDPREETVAGCPKQSQREMMWDWLAAADRYGLERMRLMCERALSKTIDVENAVDTLELADRHHCPQLKAFCLDYIASPGVITAVMATEGYKQLKVTCPSLLVDVLEKLGGNR